MIRKYENQENVKCTFFSTGCDQASKRNNMDRFGDTEPTRKSKVANF